MRSLYSVINKPRAPQLPPKSFLLMEDEFKAPQLPPKSEMHCPARPFMKQLMLGVSCRFPWRKALETDIMSVVLRCSFMWEIMINTRHTCHPEELHTVTAWFSGHSHRIMCMWYIILQICRSMSSLAFVVLIFYVATTILLAIMYSKWNSLGLVLVTCLLTASGHCSLAMPHTMWNWTVHCFDGKLKIREVSNCITRP